MIHRFPLYRLYSTLQCRGNISSRMLCIGNILLYNSFLCHSQDWTVSKIQFYLVPCIVIHNFYVSSILVCIMYHDTFYTSTFAKRYKILLKYHYKHIFVLNNSKRKLNSICLQDTQNSNKCGKFFLCDYY